MSERSRSWRELAERGQDVSWGDLSRSQQRTVVLVGAVELALTSLALLDLSRRTDDEVRGTRRRWLAIVFVQPFGPLLYLLWGRRASA